ncbi:hypothetical protein [Rhodococcus phage REQ1]|nr:hypothetical protein RoPhREQ1_gp31 [Rhodococcus phage REQ1]AEV52027.1 hypothetical protein [Rhodococcus phage REQ1]
MTRPQPCADYIEIDDHHMGRMRIECYRRRGHKKSHKGFLWGLWYRW